MQQEENYIKILINDNKYIINYYFHIIVIYKIYKRMKPTIFNEIK